MMLLEDEPLGRLYRCLSCAKETSVFYSEPDGYVEGDQSHEKPS